MRTPFVGVRIRHPAQIVVGLYLAGIAIGTVLLLLPFADRDPSSTSVLEAGFTATSALCLTGLVVVDTGSHWSPFGQVVILVLIQLGGLGITVLASVFAVMVSHRLGLRSRLLAQTETGSIELGSLNALIRRILVFSLLFELAGAAILTMSFWQAREGGLADAAWHGVFHAVSAYNNAGFSPDPASLTGYASNPLVLGAISLLVIVGGIGYPVLNDLVARWRRPRTWSLHTKLTLSATGALLIGGALLILALEWSNPATLGELSILDRVSNAVFGSVTPRTAGFNTIDYGAVREPTLLLTESLMLIGGGSASTAGGIKVTTFALLGFVIWAELRGEPEVNVFDRRVPTTTQREALSVALLFVGAIVVGAFVLGITSNYPEGDLLFESISALGTVGLSTGITPSLSPVAQAFLALLMLIGRLGPVTFGTAFVLRSRDRLYRYPEDRPLIG